MVVSHCVLDIEPGSSAKTQRVLCLLSNSVFCAFEAERHQLPQASLFFRFPSPSPDILGAHLSAASPVSLEEGAEGPHHGFGCLRTNLAYLL